MPSDDATPEVRAAREVLFLDHVRRARAALTLARSAAEHLGVEHELGRIQRSMRALNGDDLTGTARYVMHRSEAQHAIKRAQSQLHDARRVLDNASGQISAANLDEIRKCIYSALGELESTP